MIRLAIIRWLCRSLSGELTSEHQGDYHAWLVPDDQAHPDEVWPEPVNRHHTNRFCQEEGCEAEVVMWEAEAENVLSAPGWHSWPVPPPDHMVRKIPVAYHVTETCAEGHRFTHRERVSHRFDRCQVYCSRCGVHVSEAEIKKCMPSNVEVLVRP